MAKEVKAIKAAKPVKATKAVKGIKKEGRGNYPTLFISDSRMLELMQWCIDTGLANTEREFLQQIGFPPTNISNIKYGVQSFTKDHIYIAAKVTGVNINWIFGLEPNILRSSKLKTPKEMLREAVAAVEAQLK